MAKISTYPSADTPLLLSDRLIGTEAPRIPPSLTPLATKNFSLSELLNLFSVNFPAASLQAVLNTGNTATQNIYLTGQIEVDVIKPVNIEDTTGSQGATFQYLSKGTSSINWVTLPVDNLQAVLNSGNSATQNIKLVGNITSTLVTPENIKDELGNLGILGQILTKTAAGIKWANSSVPTAPSLADVLSTGNSATNDINLTGDMYATSFVKSGGLSSEFLKADGSVDSSVYALASSLPTLTSDLTNDGDDGINPFISLADVPAQVNSDWNATSGVAEILNKPTIPAAQVNADWNATSGVAEILNKPTIPTTLPPSGAAGGDLQGTYPNPTVHRVHGVDFQSGAPAVDDTWIYVSTPLGPQPFQWQHSKLKTSQVQNDSTVTGTNADDALEHLDSSKVPTTRTISTTAPLSGGGDLSANRTLSIPQATTSVDGYLSATDWTTFNGKQGAITLTTTGTSGAATFIGNTLNIPQYSNIYNADGSLTAARTLTLNSFALTILGTTSSRFFANGNVGIGTTTDAGYKLDVSGSARANSIFFGAGLPSVLSVDPTTALTNITTAGTSVRIGDNVGSTISGYQTYVTSPGIADRQYTSGEGGVMMLGSSLGFNRTFSPTSGTGVFNILRLSSTINQTGGASGITRGLYINPTLTAAANFRAIETTAGRIVISDTATVTGTNATSLLDLSQTWNTTGAPIALKVNITDTASAALSDLISLQVGGSARFRVLKSGYFVHNTGGEIGGALVVGSSTISASSQLEVTSTTRGFLPPRMTTTQKNAIASPAAGLVVYDTTLGKLCVFSTTWQTITSL